MKAAIVAVLLLYGPKAEMNVTNKCARTVLYNTVVLVTQIVQRVANM